MPAENVATPPQLRSIAIVDLVARRNLNPFEMSRLVAAQDGSVDFNVNFDIDDQAWGPAEGDVPEPAGTSHRYHFRLMLDLEIQRPSAVLEQTGENPGPIWEVHIAIEVGYSLAPDQAAPEPSQVGAFVHQNAQFQTWPFLREAAASALARLSLPQMLLPQLNAQLDEVYFGLANDAANRRRASAAQ